MGKLKIDRKDFDHPEDFDDEIREYRSSSRYHPTALEQLLYEMAGHRCTICREPLMEIHHIQELSQGGETSIDNLIVLCPNCHARVHASGVPTQAELHHYKLKQEIAYELPVLSRISDAEWELVAELAQLPAETQIHFSRRYWEEVTAEAVEQALEWYRRKVGLAQLQESGLLTVEQENAIGMADGRFTVVLVARFTGKGVRWVRYLSQAGRIRQPSTR